MPFYIRDFSIYTFSYLEGGSGANSARMQRVDCTLKLAVFIVGFKAIEYFMVNV
jgi:hypothetical protein